MCAFSDSCASFTTLGAFHWTPVFRTEEAKFKRPCFHNLIISLRWMRMPCRGALIMWMSYAGWERLCFFFFFWRKTYSFCQLGVHHKVMYMFFSFGKFQFFCNHCHHQRSASSPLGETWQSSLLFASLSLHRYYTTGTPNFALNYAFP